MGKGDISEMQTKYNMGEIIATKKRVSVVTGFSQTEVELQDAQGNLTGETKLVTTYTTGDGFAVEESQILGTIERSGK